MTDRLASLGERGLLARLLPTLPTRQDVILGAGDDCALVAAPAAEEALVLKVDPVREGVHFTPDTEGALVGRKALGRVLSDFAAMGAEPRWALAAFTAPADEPLARVQAVFDGFCALARAHGVAVVGGDTAVGPRLEVVAFAAGVVNPSRAMRRNALRAGDTIWVTGRLGASFPTGRHLSFPPRLAQGAWLAARGERSRACIDISDGLSTELWHLARASQAALWVDAASIPLTEACAAFPDAIRHAFCDGEDFELLFSVPPTDVSFARDWGEAFPDVPCSCIGRVVATGAHPEVMLREASGEERVLPDGGFDHFRSA